MSSHIIQREHPFGEPGLGEPEHNVWDALLMSREREIERSLNKHKTIFDRIVGEAK